MTALPYYLAMGMPYDLFWNGDPRLVRSYREASKLRNQQKNQEMWIQGIYFQRALKSTIEHCVYGLAGGMGSKPSEYPESPLPFTEAEQKAATERSKEKTLKWVESGQH